MALTVRSHYFSLTSGTSNDNGSHSIEDNCQDEVQLDQAVLYKDPLFCRHFRAFCQLYQRLALMKPVMIQETVANDPWKLLISVILLNKTTGRLAIPVFWRIIRRWPTPWLLSQADNKELSAMIRPLGTHNIRARRIISVSQSILLDPPNPSDLRISRCTISIGRSSQRQQYPPTPISHLPGAGPYALDSYRIFCTTNQDTFNEEWTSVIPSDKELVRFLKWKWAFVKRKAWYPETGETHAVNQIYLETLITWLAQRRERS